MSSSLWSGTANATATANVKEDCNDTYSFEELQAIEKKRRETLEATEYSPMRSIFHIQGAGIPDTLMDPVMVVSMGLYLSFRIIRRFEGSNKKEIVQEFEESTGYEATIAQFLSFFQTIIFSLVYSRYFSQYLLSASCQGRIFDLSSLAAHSLEIHRARRLVRYVNAAHIAAYVGVSKTYTFLNFFSKINETWNLLTELECQRMQDINMDTSGGSCVRELISWSIREVQSAFRRGQIDAELAQQMRQHILSLRGAIGGIYDYDDQPLPYFLSYFVLILSCYYLPMSALATGAALSENLNAMEEIISFVLVFANCFCVVGLRVLSKKLAKPYESNVEGLSVMAYVQGTCLSSFRILASQPPPGSDEANPEEEEQLAQGRNSSLGAAFSSGRQLQQQQQQRQDFKTA